MSRPVHCFLILLFLNTGAGNEFFADPRGDWLARQIENRDIGKDARMSIRMRLYDRQARARERVLTMMSMRGGTGRPVPGNRTLIRFEYPNDIKGTAFLVWESPSADDERFLYLPSLGRVRRIAGSETQESFVGSDFTYEDIGGREFEEYSYTMLAEDATWKAADGSTHPAYRLESRRRSANARFPRVVSLVRKDAFVVVHAEIFDRRDELQKTFDVRRLEKADGYWTALEMRMTDARERTRTDLVIEKVDYDVGLKPDDFSRRELERGGRLRAEGASASAQSATARPRRSSKSEVGSASLAVALAKAGR